MNFMPATVDGDRLRLPLGEVRLHDEARRALEGADGGGRDVIAGIRPEDFQDAALVEPGKQSEGHTFEARIELTESMGSEIYAYFQYEGGGAQSDVLSEIAEDAGTSEVPGAGESQVVARLDPTSKAREGEQIQLWMDTRKLHLFAASDGANLTRRAAA
jgi:multiple sugar transport system ATP-binding protein